MDSRDGDGRRLRRLHGDDLAPAACRLMRVQDAQRIDRAAVLDPKDRLILGSCLHLRHARGIFDADGGEDCNGIKDSII
jgi:hypothetical protein